MSTYFGYVDVTHLDNLAQLLQPMKQRMYAQMKIDFGDRILDIGCGPGIDTVQLAPFVGSQGRVVGVDFDESFIAEANRRAVLASVDSWVSHQKADALALPFPANSFDICRCERLLQHLVRPQDAISEMKRVVRPGGRIVVADVDWGSMTVETDETDIGRRLTVLEVELHHSGLIGRKLFRLFRQNDLTEIVVEMFSLSFTNYDSANNILGLDELAEEAVKRGNITQQEFYLWQQNLELLANRNEFFASLSGMVVTGLKLPTANMKTLET